MKRFDVRDIGAILLIVAGGLLLLQNFGILRSVVALVWALIFAAGGLVFLYVFLTNRANWWAIIPGFALLGLGALIALDEFFPRVGDAWGGAISLMANYHAAFAGGGILGEWPMPAFPLRDELLVEPLRMRNGRLFPPETPGLGVALRPKIEERYPFKEEAVYQCPVDPGMLTTDASWRR